MAYRLAYSDYATGGGEPIPGPPGPMGPPGPPGAPGTSATGPYLLLAGGHVTPGKLQVGATGWLEPVIGATEAISDFVTLSDSAGPGGVFGTRTGDGGTTGGSGAWAIGGFALNNNLTAIQTAWGQYLEARRYAGAGTTQGLEICPVNHGDLKQNQPYFMGQTGSTLGLWLNSGRDDASTNNDNSLALGIIAGDALWDRGIMFGHDSVRSGVAIGMPPQYQFVWYLNDAGASHGVGVPGAVISANVSSVAGLAHPPTLFFGNGSLLFDPGNNVIAAEFEVGLNTFQASQFNGDVTLHNGSTETLHLSTSGNISTTGSLTVAGNAGVNNLSATTSLQTGGGTGPTWTSGTVPPAGAAPIGSLYSQTNGAVGATLFVSRGGGTWAAVAGV